MNLTQALQNLMALFVEQNVAPLAEKWYNRIINSVKCRCYDVVERGL